MPGARRVALLRDLRALPEDIAAGVCPTRSKAATAAWALWCRFCAELRTDPGLSEYDDPIPILMLFTRQYRTGILAPNQKPVRARTAEDALRFVGQAFASVGALDPRRTTHGAIDYRITRQLAGWKKADPPSRRREIIPRCVLDSVTSTAWQAATAQDFALSDLMWLGIHFLLRPSEYLYTDAHHAATAFTMADLRFKLPDGTTVPGPHLPANARPTHVGLHFTEQKNGISGEVIYTPRASTPDTCPVECALRRLRHLQHNGARPTTPLFVFYHTGLPLRLSSRILTATLRVHADIRAPHAHISAAGIRATAATALLSGRVPIHLIKLLGRWRSDEVFRYFHTHAQTTRDLSPTLLQHLT